MMDCYFTAEQVKQTLTGLEAWQEANPVDLFREILTNACREILRLNEVIEGMKQEHSTMVHNLYCIYCGSTEIGDSRQCQECDG